MSSQVWTNSSSDDIICLLDICKLLSICLQVICRLAQFVNKTPSEQTYFREAVHGDRTDTIVC